MLFIVTPVVGFCNCSLFCCTSLYVPSSFAIILMGKRELVALLSLSSWCLVIVVWLFHSVPWVCLQFMIVVFPDPTHVLFLSAQIDGIHDRGSRFVAELETAKKIISALVS